jgi:hypothetical protein
MADYAPLIRPTRSINALGVLHGQLISLFGRQIDKKAPRRTAGLFQFNIVMRRCPSFAGLAATYSSKSWDLVPSALGSLTAEFGMGSGTGSPLEPPGRRKTDDGGWMTDVRQRMSDDRCRRTESDSGSSRTSAKQADLFHSFQSSDIRRLTSEWVLRNENDQANRAISTGKLNALLRLHLRPINVVVYHGSQGRTRFEVGFPLRCFQRLSRPYIAMQHCGWRHNCSTRGTSNPVLSY